MKFTDLLAAPVGGGVDTKLAAEMPNRQQIEKDFSNLAFTFLRDRAPSLLPYLVGFETVEQDPDGSRAIGIFGFSLGDRFLYVPAFFIANQIKGMDLLYSVDENMFYPLRESWINELVNRQSLNLGEGVASDQKLRASFDRPNFEFVARPPLTGTGAKLASDKTDAKSKEDKKDDQLPCPGSKILSGGLGLGLGRGGGKGPMGIPLGAKLTSDKTEDKSKEDKKDEKAKDEKAKDEKAKDDQLPCPGSKILSGGLGLGLGRGGGKGPLGIPLGAKLATVLNGAVDWWNGIREDVAARMAETDGDPDFQRAVAGAMARLTKQAVEQGKADDSLLRKWVFGTSGVEGAKRLAMCLTSPDYAKAAATFYDLDDLLIHEFDAKLQKQAATVTLELVTVENMYGAVAAEPKTRERVLRDSFAIVDKRPDDQKSELYTEDYLKRVSNPDQPGRYDLFLSGGMVADAYIIHPQVYPGKLDSGDRPLQVVVNPESRTFFLADNQSMYVRNPVDEEPVDERVSRSGQELYAKAGPVSDAEVGGRYILIDDRCRGSLPFKVQSVIRQSGDELVLQVNWRNYPTFVRAKSYVGSQGIGDKVTNMTVGNAQPSRPSQYAPYSDSPDHLVPTDKAGLLTVSGTRLIVPTRTYKLLRLEEPKPGISESEQPFQPASFAEIGEAMEKISAHRLVVEHAGAGEFNILLDGLLDQQALTYKQAMVRLVGNYALPVEGAETMLKEAVDHIKSRRFALLKQGQQVYFGPPPVQGTGYDPQIGAGVQDPQYALMRGKTQGLPPWEDAGPGSGINVADPTGGMPVGGPEPLPIPGGDQVPGQGFPMPPDAAMLAQQAAGTGQQQVFDAATIGGLAQTYDTASSIDAMLPELMAAMDRLGRMLFLFYWRNEDFATRYGDQDLTDLEDQLRSVFKNYGDLVLKLKRKSIESVDEAFIQPQQ